MYTVSENVVISITVSDDYRDPLPDTIDITERIMAAGCDDIFAASVCRLWRGHPVVRPLRGTMTRICARPRRRRLPALTALSPGVHSPVRGMWRRSLEGAVAPGGVVGDADLVQAST